MARTVGSTPIEFGDDLMQRERIERRENALLEAVGINPASHRPQRRWPVRLGGGEACR